MHRGQPDQSPFLADDGEDEIGRTLRQELQLCLAAVEIALAEHAAGTDGDLRLNDVVAGPERIGLRIEKCQHALALIVVQQEMPCDVAGRNQQARSLRQSA